MLLLFTAVSCGLTDSTVGRNWSSFTAVSEGGGDPLDPQSCHVVQSSVIFPQSVALTDAESRSPSHAVFPDPLSTIVCSRADVG